MRPHGTFVKNTICARIPKEEGGICGGGSCVLISVREKSWDTHDGTSRSVELKRGEMEVGDDDVVSGIWASDAAETSDGYDSVAARRSSNIGVTRTGCTGKIGGVRIPKLSCKLCDGDGDGACGEE